MGILETSLLKTKTKVPWSYLAKQFTNEAFEQISQNLKEFVATEDFTLGEPLKEFEKRFASLIGTKFAFGVNSGTDAIKLSLKSLNIGPGSEVITTANTFIATVGAIVENHATPVFVDCTDNLCMNVDQIEAAITPRTKAIVAVHLAGQMTDMPKLLDISQKYSLPIVEDACQCILGNINGKNAGTYGVFGAFSLHPLKNLNVWGDGGMIVTNDEVFADKISLLRNHGLRSRDTVEIMGCNSRLDTLQAIIGNWLIPQVDIITNTRIKNAAYLDTHLKDIPAVTLPSRFTNRKLVFHLYILFVKKRDELLKFLQRKGIQAKIHYPLPVYRQPALSYLGYKKGDFPATDLQAETMISLPAHDHLQQEQLDYMINCIKEFYNA